MHKVEITGVDTSKLKTLSKEECQNLLIIDDEAKL